MTKYNFNKEKIYDLYINQNFTLEDLSKRYNAPIITIQRFLRKNDIKKVERKNYLSIIPKIREYLNLGWIHKDIANELNITVDVLRHIIYQQINSNDNIRFSNKLSNDSWININSSTFWYIIGIITSDGHVDKTNNIVSIFQSNFEYLKRLQKLINHHGKLYKSSDSEYYTLQINNNKLYTFLINNNFDTDKRYNVPYLNPSKDLLKYFVRGLFDGDGCLYYRYISGMFEGKRFQITSGSKSLLYNLKSDIESSLNLILNIHHKISTTQNDYFDLFSNNTEDILKILSWMYSGDIKNFCLIRKYKSYIKLKNLIKLDKQVNDIVDASMKIEE